MNLGSRTVFLLSVLLVLSALALAGAGLAADPERRNVEIFTEMVRGLRVDAYEPNAYFVDGRTLQALPAGVVARGFPPFPYGTGPEEAARAGRELQNPLPDDVGTRARGAELYRISCLPCHDARGNGKGKVVLRGMLPPPSLHAARALSVADGELFHIITRGQGNMAPYAAQLSPTERWQVVQHLRALQKEGP